VDDSWFERACDEELLGVPVKHCAPEEMIWMKAYIMERERFDALTSRTFFVCTEEIDCRTFFLVRRFGPDWRIWFSHLILFGYILPGERARIPAIMEDLIIRLRSEVSTAGPERLCRGTLLRGSNI